MLINRAQKYLREYIRVIPPQHNVKAYPVFKDDFTGRCVFLAKIIKHDITEDLIFDLKDIYVRSGSKTKMYAIMVDLSRNIAEIYQ